MKANGQYEAGDRLKRGDSDVVVEKDETDEEFEARTAPVPEEKAPRRRGRAEE